MAISVGGEGGAGGGGGEEEDAFVLQPIVRPDLPDEWVLMPAPEGDYYYVNYARNQRCVVWLLQPTLFFFIRPPFFLLTNLSHDTHTHTHTPCSTWELPPK